MPKTGPHSDGKILDTDQIRKSYRRLIRKAMVLASVIALIYSLWYYLMGIDLWWQSLAFSALSLSLHPLAEDHRPFALFLTCILVFFAAVVFYIVTVTLHLGHAAGFQYLMFAILPVIIFSGRIGLTVKWILAGVLCAIFLWVDATSLSAPLGGSNSSLVTLLREFNIFVTFVVLGYLIQVYFIDIAKIQQRLNNLAWIDPLTELLNRRRITEVASLEFKRSERHGGPVSLILLDIDLFKAINDRFGHEDGDNVLRKASQIIMRLIRDSDRACRWGGEEFLILLPNTDHQGALNLAERIREGFEQEAICLAKGETHISLTLGVVTRNIAENLESAIQRADKALYAGKAGGRNRVVSAG